MHLLQKAVNPGDDMLNLHFQYGLQGAVPMLPRVISPPMVWVHLGVV